SWVTLSNNSPTFTSIPSSSFNSRRRQSSNVSPACRLPPGNSHNPPRCVPQGRCVRRRRPPRNTRPAATSIGWGLGVLECWSDGSSILCITPLLPYPNAPSPSHTLIDESKLLHFLWIKKISSVEHDRMGQCFA